MTYFPHAQYRPTPGRYVREPRPVEALRLRLPLGTLDGGSAGASPEALAAWCGGRVHPDGAAVDVPALVDGYPRATCVQPGEWLLRSSGDGRFRVAADVEFTAEYRRVTRGPGADAVTA